MSKYFEVKPLSEEHSELAAETEKFLNLLWEDLPEAEQKRLFSEAIHNVLDRHHHREARRNETC